MTELETERLILRTWRPEDREPFAALNADPVVMLHFPSVLTREQSDSGVDRIEAHFESNGWGLWAVEIKHGPSFIGFVGLARVPFEASFTPAVEIGWRLAKDHHRKGYAPEAARAALRYAFEQLELPEVVSFTVPANAPSRSVMEKIGLSHAEADDFDHPWLDDDSPLKRHVLYRISRQVWQEKNGVSDPAV